VVTIITTSLTFNNSTFCPHTVFMCFVWISEQTAIISLYNINWLVCITETECVYCAVRTGLLKFIVYSRRSSEFDPGPVRLTFTVDKVPLGVLFLKYFAYRWSESFHHCSTQPHLCNLSSAIQLRPAYLTVLKAVLLRISGSIE